MLIEIQIHWELDMQMQIRVTSRGGPPPSELIAMVLADSILGVANILSIVDFVAAGSSQCSPTAAVLAVAIELCSVHAS